MNKIILYDDSLEDGKKAFITPLGKVILLCDKHEVYAQNYCEGDLSKLTKEELILYRYWLSQNDNNKREMYGDFLADVLGFDKVLRIMRKSITTTSPTPHIRFYNYYLMDWYIDIRNRVVYNEKTGIFEPVNKGFITLSEDREFEEEINSIKSKVKLKDRHHFFR